MRLDVLYASMVLALSLMLGSTSVAQKLSLVPHGGQAAQCRGVDVNTYGGDDNHTNIWFIEVDPSILSGTNVPDFYIHLWDGDNNAVLASSGIQDYDRMDAAGNDAFEYRLFGGPGAAINDETMLGQDPPAFSGMQIDIDSDPGDATLRTDDPDDIDGNAAEDLRDQDFSLIAVDGDANPGDLVGGRRIYKFVVDGRLGPGREWNRYRIGVSRDAARTDATGVALFVYQLSIAGKPDGAGEFSLNFRVPATPTHQIDIQTLDLDHGTVANPVKHSILTTTTQVFGDGQTYESDNQYSGGAWSWTSVNQPIPHPAGNGVTGAMYSTVGEEGSIWKYQVDAHGQYNPFSIRIADVNGGLLPIHLASERVGQANGPLSSLSIGNVGTMIEGGPIYVAFEPGSAVTLKIRGPAGSPYVLVMGPQGPGATPLGCIGSLDIGTPGLGSLTVLIDGFATPLFTIGGNGEANLPVNLPVLPPQNLANIQALVSLSGTCPLSLTASLYVHLR